MTSFSRRSARVAGLTALAVTLLVAPTTSVAVPVAAPAAACDATNEAARAVPGVSAAADSSDLGPAERARTAAERTRVIGANARSSANVEDLPEHILVPVYVHVIRGTHASENRVSNAKVRQVIALLRDAYSGKQSGYSFPTRFSFTVQSITVTKSDRWYHASMNSRYDQQMKRSLHRGFSRALNLYINEPGGAQGLLGYARFPWQYSGRPYLDGVTVHVDSLPGGSFGGFNLGDTVVHEVGHWLGLFHTFQSSTGDGCDPINDGVADTPAEIEPNGRRAGLCDNPGNVCDITELTIDGLRDPVFNFMDYSSDRCMREFTQGQSERMDFEYATYRY